MLSVLIAAFDVGASIRRAVDSAVCAAAVEVVIAPDDGSARYQGLEADYPGRVRVLPPTVRAGPGASRNRAFAAARGTFVTMLDGDDYFAPGALDEALALATHSAHRVAFLRTVYVDDDTGAVVRELARSPSLGLQAFIDFHGSIHALLARERWRPYSAHRISQDVLFDAGMLLESGGAAPLTDSPHVKTIRSASLTRSTDQAEINAEYAQIIGSGACPGLERLFAEKLRIGELYERARSAGLADSFHDFVRQLSATSPPPRPAAGRR